MTESRSKRRRKKGLSRKKVLNVKKNGKRGREELWKTSKTGEGDGQNQTVIKKKKDSRVG